MTSSKTTALLIGLAAFAVGVGLVLFFGPKGRADLRITAVSQGAMASTQAPWGMFWSRDNTYVIVRGELDGTARLHVFWDQSHTTTELGPGKIYIKQGGADQRCKTLKVTFEPGSAKSGELNIALLCGRNAP